MGKDKDQKILECLESGMGFVATAKEAKSSYRVVKRIADANDIKAWPERRIVVGSRFGKVLLAQVDAECEKLGVNRSDFILMLSLNYFKERE